jgi:coenzyme PQQ synthesis protein D (PqqD)
VIDEAFDGEAVLVHMGTGCYFSLNAAATAVWALLQDGRSPVAIAASLGWDPSLVEDFVERLRAELLVEEAEGDAGTTLVDAPPAESEPVLQRFSDMQDLLMLDPIHDIDLDGDGWPVTRAPAG